MKTWNLTRSLMILLLGISTSAIAFPFANAEFPRSNTSGAGSDTAAVLKYTRKALQFTKKSSLEPGKPALEKIKENIDSAEYICDRENIDMPALLHLARAEYFLITKDFRNASEEADVALKLARNTDDTEVILKTHNFLGRYNYVIGFASESIQNLTKVIELAKSKKIKGYVPLNYMQLSSIYLRILRDTTEHQKFLRVAINEAKKEADSSVLGESLYRLGTSCINFERNFKLADSLLMGALTIARNREDYTLIISALANIGYNYYLEKRYKEAIDYYNKSLKYYTGANALGNLGTIYRDLGDYRKSLEYYEKSLKIAKHDNDVYNLMWVYQDLSNLYLKNRDTANAYLSYVQYNKYYIKYTGDLNRQNISEEKIRYEAESHAKELQLLSLKLKNQRLLIYGYTGLFVLCLAIGILIISRSRINTRHKISDMNRKIAEITQANLRQQMNPHFIFNTLNSIQYYMYQHDKLATNNYLTKFSSLMRKVLENSQHTSIPLRDELDALKLYLDLEMIRFKDKFSYEIKIDEELDTLLYKVPAMLIQPYVENSISHGLMPSEDKGLIRINLRLTNNHISCTIEDNGIGREAAQEKKRNGREHHNSLGTQIVTSRLDLVNTLYGTSLKTIYTDLKNTNGEPEGTRVEIQIPIMT